MRNWKYPIIGIMIAALFGFAGTGVAQAASSETVSGSCALGPGAWDINMSVTYINTSGSPSRGTVTKIRVTAPHPIDAWSEAQKPNGSYWADGVYPSEWTVSTGGGRYAYEYTYPSGRPTGIHGVDIWVSPAGGSSTCGDWMYAYN